MGGSVHNELSKSCKITPMKPSHILISPARMLLVALLVVFSLYSMYQMVFASMHIGDTGSERLDQWEADMQLIRESLPLERGVVGYISEEDLEGVEFAFWDNETEFMLTQYGLAPLILKKGLAGEWNVVVLKEANLKQWLDANPGYYELIKVKGRFSILHDLGTP